jgi:hypothetical protein
MNVKLGIGFGCGAAPMAVAPMTKEAANATPPIKTILDIANFSSFKLGRSPAPARSCYPIE